MLKILIIDKSSVKRIVKRIKGKGGSIPTRGEIKDIGPGISHKARIIELLLNDVPSCSFPVTPIVAAFIQAR